MKIVHYSTPTDETKRAVVNIIESLGDEWFTDEVSEETSRDLLLQHCLTAEEDDEVVAFLTFSSMEGVVRIGLMATKAQFRNRGYGKALIKKLKEISKELGFSRIGCLTVPEESNPRYSSTLKFYLSCGFTVQKEYTEIWENGAIELLCELE